MPEQKETKETTAVWGPGTWNTIHLTAAWATSIERAEFYYQWLKLIISNLPCGECRNHAAEYMVHNPTEEAEDLFLHAWRFHNAVNKRLGKPEMDYNTAAERYLGGGIKTCNSGCGK